MFKKLEAIFEKSGRLNMDRSQPMLNTIAGVNPVNKLIATEEECELLNGVDSRTAKKAGPLAQAPVLANLDHSRRLYIRSKSPKQ